MCGRINLGLDPEAVRDFYDVERVNALRDPSWNLAPTDELAVVTRDPADDARVLDAYRWGLVPHWARDPVMGASLFNARAETVHEKPAFRDAWQAGHRLVVPATGFYEWQRTGAGKRPLNVRRRDGDPLSLAGVWSRWEGDGQDLVTFTVLTTEPNGVMAPVHHRMPVVLHSRDHVEAWLDPEVPPEDARELLVPCPDDVLEVYEVSKRVNDASHDGPDLVEHVGARSSRLDEFL